MLFSEAVTGVDAASGRGYAADAVAAADSVRQQQGDLDGRIRRCKDKSMLLVRFRIARHFKRPFELLRGSLSRDLFLLFGANS